MAGRKGVRGDPLCVRTDAAQATEVVIGVAVLNRMLDPGRPNSILAA